jgi:chromate reductase, NAD(P)H dehydrogenase (quinone)
MSDLRILGIPGSLRKNADSTGLLLAAQELAPPGVRVEIADVRDFPVFNQDDEGNLPAPVRAFHEQAQQADAFLFSLNEHNFGFSAHAKNVVDWGSRPRGASVWDD